MQTIDIHAARAEHNRLCNLIEDLDARLGGQYDPVLDDLQREAAELRWQLWNA
ncbi:MAG TPA: hypothetical protein VFF52_07410 [Isosphaeraceae bacterium]|nr:hypothetical protein [Isosphaeraceae bacterium]